MHNLALTLPLTLTLILPVTLALTLILTLTLTLTLTLPLALTLTQVKDAMANHSGNVKKEFGNASICNTPCIILVARLAILLSHP